MDNDITNGDTTNDDNVNEGLRPVIEVQSDKEKVLEKLKTSHTDYRLKTGKSWESEVFEVVAVHLSDKCPSFSNVVGSDDFAFTTLTPFREMGGNVAPMLMEFTPKLQGRVKAKAVILMSVPEVRNYFEEAKSAFEEKGRLDDFKRFMEEARFAALYEWALQELESDPKEENSGLKFDVTP